MKTILQFIKKHPYYTTAIVVALVAISAILFQPKEKQPEEVATQTRGVETISVSDNSQGSIGVAVPTAGGNSFVIRTESGGRVESVTKTGVTVTQGAILAQLENSAQLAALTQAEGAYEAAVAGANQSTFNVESSEETLTSSYNSANTDLRSSGITVEGIMENTIDSFFTDSTRQRLELDEYFWEKKLLDYALDDWNELTKNTVPDNQIASELDTYISVTQRVADLLNAIYSNVLDEENGATSDYQTTLSTYKGNLTTAKATIATELQTLKDVKLNVTDAKSALDRAKSSSLGGTTSAEEARIKQALGSLQSARSNYNKTIIRAPFAGTIVSFNVATGDIINTGTDIAIIVPEEGVETTKSFNLPISAIKYTPDNSYVLTVNSEYQLEALNVETGLVTADTIKVTGLNGDETIVADVRGLKAGQIVTVSN